MGEKLRLWNVSGSFREFQQGLMPWTADALRIGEVLADDPFKRLKQFLFRTHSAPRDSNMGVRTRSPLFLWENPTTRDWCR